MDETLDSEKLLGDSSRSSLSSHDEDLVVQLQARRRTSKLIRCYQWLTVVLVLLVLGSNIAWYRVFQAATIETSFVQRTKSESGELTYYKSSLCSEVSKIANIQHS